MRENLIEKRTMFLIKFALNRHLHCVIYDTKFIKSKQQNLMQFIFYAFQSTLLFSYLEKSKGASEKKNVTNILSKSRLNEYEEICFEHINCFIYEVDQMCTVK